MSVIDKWKEGHKTYKGTITLEMGIHDLKYEMYENAGSAESHLYVTPPGGSKIFVQPARTAEFIVLDFVVLPTGASFPE